MGANQELNAPSQPYLHVGILLNNEQGSGKPTVGGLSIPTDVGN